MNTDSVIFKFGDFVYLKVKPLEAGMITGILFRPSGVLYYVTWGDSNEKCYHDIEITKEKQYVVSGD